MTIESEVVTSGETKRWQKSPIATTGRESFRMLTPEQNFKDDWICSHCIVSVCIV